MSRLAQPSWTTVGEAAQLWFARPTLRKTIRIAIVVGTLLSLINQGSVVLGGHATAVTWVRIGFNYLVPFCVSSLGYLSATRARPSQKRADVVPDRLPIDDKGPR